jgi:hypothetical protein
MQKKTQAREDDFGSLFGEGITGKLPRYANKITFKVLNRKYTQLMHINTDTHTHFLVCFYTQRFLLYIKKKKITELLHATGNQFKIRVWVNSIIMRRSPGFSKVHIFIGSLKCPMKTLFPQCTFHLYLCVFDLIDTCFSYYHFHCHLHCLNS